MQTSNFNRKQKMENKNLLLKQFEFGGKNIVGSNIFKVQWNVVVQQQQPGNSIHKIFL